MEGFDATTYGERFADVYDDWYEAVSDVEGTVQAVAALAAGRPVLELGVGTGRLALPLAALGLEVHGVDASPAMLERLQAKPGGGSVRTVLGDFSVDLPEVDGGFSVALIAFNTFFNLSSREAQQRCFASVAERLRPGGAFVLEAFVADLTSQDADVTPTVVGADEVVLQVTRRDRASQTVRGSIVSFSQAGGVRLRPWFIRYAQPDELDVMASAAGFALASRAEGWRGEPFDDASPRHVSVYRRGGPTPEETT